MSGRGANSDDDGSGVTSGDIAVDKGSDSTGSKASRNELDSDRRDGSGSRVGSGNTDRGCGQRLASNNTERVGLGEERGESIGVRDAGG